MLGSQAWLGEVIGPLAVRGEPEVESEVAENTAWGPVAQVPLNGEDPKKVAWEEVTDRDRGSRPTHSGTCQALTI